MELRNCRKCQKLFISISGRLICQECYEVEEEKYDRILKYLGTHPDASIKEICEATQNSEESVVELVKKGKITLNVSVVYRCEICGKKITSGKACPECRKKMEEELDKVIEKVKKEQGEAKARDLATKYALEIRSKRRRR
jgi:protein-arginine kinase activator protein McsA